MKQLVQPIDGKETTIENVPQPALSAGRILVRTAVSVISAGTERMAVEFAEKNLIGKARARPDLVAQVLDKARREGILPTLNTVLGRLGTPMAPGYSSSGTVIAVGEGVSSIQIGDRVACAGANYAVHAEVVSVPENLVVKLDDRVEFEAAAFTTLGAIALHGFRLAEPRLGETVAVIGLGLLGLLSVQIARAAGCRVIGYDPLESRCELAVRLGCHGASSDLAKVAAYLAEHSESHGADVVLITAATESSAPLALAGELARDRACVVAVGAVGMELPRRIFFDKELDFRISRSYGPGRYDPEYEEKGRDYPIGYVRWTEKRNMASFVELLASGKIDIESLITHRFPIEEGVSAFDLISGKTEEPYLGIVLTYPPAAAAAPAARVDFHPAGSPGTLGIGLLGAGNFASSVLLPAMKKVADLELVGVCDAASLSGQHAAKRFGFAYACASAEELLADPAIGTLVIATPHQLHAEQAAAALQAGKHVFCEKPLALNVDELRSVIDAWRAAAGPQLMVGYNRRFSPMALQVKEFFAPVAEPKVMHYRVNAGYIPLESWVQDFENSGGRIIGEVCHFVDLLTFFAGALPVSVRARALPNAGKYLDDNLLATIEFADHSLGSIMYVANGDKALAKERVEVFAGGQVAILDDYRQLGLVRAGKRKQSKSRLSQDKGHAGEWQAFAQSLRSGSPAPIPVAELVSASLVTFAILQSLRTGETVEINMADILGGDQ